MKTTGRWRCDDCVEEFTVAVEVLDSDIAIRDLAITVMPCPICDGPMRRLDPRVE